MDMLSDSAMINHLESGECACGVDSIYMYSAAASCKHALYFIDGKYLEDLQRRQDPNREYGNHLKLFRCPDKTCVNTFHRLLDLFVRRETVDGIGKTFVSGEAVDELKKALMYLVADQSLRKERLKHGEKTT